jgi:serine/threonine-protein kinase RsbW
MVLPLKEACGEQALHHGGTDPAFTGGPDCRVCPFRSAREIVPLIEAMVMELGASGYTTREAFAVRLALEEAMVNAIKHGHRGDLSKVAQLRYRVTPECLLAEVEDQGAGFNPDDVPDPLDPDNLERPCGRGLLLMRSYMTWVRYNATGTCVHLGLRRQAP